MAGECEIVRAVRNHVRPRRLVVRMVVGGWGESGGSAVGAQCERGASVEPPHGACDSALG